MAEFKKCGRKSEELVKEDKSEEELGLRGLTTSKQLDYNYSGSNSTRLTRAMDIIDLACKRIQTDFNTRICRQRLRDN
jgi:hypothetical protein